MGRESLYGQIDIVAGIDRDGVTDVQVRAPKERRVGQHGIDDQSLVRAVLGDLEADLMRSPDDISPRNEMPGVVPILIGDRATLTDLCAPEPDDEIAILIDPLGIRPVEANLNGVWIGAGLDQKIVFEASLVAVKDEIDSRIHVVVLDAREARNA